MRPFRNEIRLTAAVALMSPILFCQGKYVRCVTPKLPEAAGGRSGECGSGTPLRLLVLGDSAAAGVGVGSQDDALIGQILKRLQEKFHVVWKVEAQIGATTRSTIAKLKISEPEPFSAVAISLGVNEVTRGRRASTWLRELNELADILRTKFSVQRMLWSGVPSMHEFPALPQPLRWYLGTRAALLDEALRIWVSSQGDCDFIAAPASGYGPMMAEDGFHPGPKVYELWGAEVARCLETISVSKASV
jgi:lysophospholipase L1-like esterase